MAIGHRSRRLRQTMTEPAANVRNGWSLGPVLILVGPAALLLARRIPETSLGNNEDPGPRAFPLALAALLVAGGLAELILNIRRRRSANASPRARPTLAGWGDSLLRRENLNAFFLIAALVAYLAAMPWIGFPVATLLFSIGMMLLLGAPIRLTAPFSVGLVVLIYVLFTMLFKVQLPAGVLGLSW